MKSFVFCELITNITNQVIINTPGFWALFWYLVCNTQKTVIYVNAGTAFTYKEEMFSGWTDSFEAAKVCLWKDISAKCNYNASSFHPPR